MLNLVELATRIKAKRREKNLTIAEVAANAEQTTSWLSKVENFRLTPSLPALLARIAVALDISMSALLQGLDEKPKISIVRKEDRREVERDCPNSNVVYQSLGHPRPNRKMDPFVLTVPAQGGREEPLGHEGEEFLMVMRGPVNFEHEEETHTLESGDCAYFDGTGTHRLSNPFQEDATVLCVFEDVS